MNMPKTTIQERVPTPTESLSSNNPENCLLAITTIPSLVTCAVEWM